MLSDSIIGFDIIRKNEMQINLFKNSDAFSSLKIEVQ